MALTDTIVASIEAELEELKAAEAPAPEPEVHQAPATAVAPLHDLIAAQAAERLARSV